AFKYISNNETYRHCAERITNALAARENKNPATIVTKNDIKVKWLSHLIPHDGYGASAIEMLDRLIDVPGFAARALPLSIACEDWIPQKVKDIVEPTIVNSGVLQVDGADYFLMYSPPIPRTSLHGLSVNVAKEKIIFCMWESSNIPKYWVNYINDDFDRIIVPTEWGREQMLCSGIRVPISVVNLGVNMSRYSYQERTKTLPFRFLTYANDFWDSPRKNCSYVFDAFKQAFGDRHDIELIIKLAKGDEGTQIARTGKVSNIPKLGQNVRLIEGALPPNELASLVQTAHCMLFPSSGEGFGLPPREAMAAGVPLIVSDSTALKEIARPDLVWVLPSTKTKPACDYPACYGNWNDLGTLDDFNIEDLSYLMKEVHTNYPLALEKAKAASKWIVNNQTYEHTTTKLLEILE
ncbi:MAG: glycosyltransferase, partial [Bacteroidetes bacterium]|nr:glycosyltransferase [Bacteroidota bacterium]